MPITPFKSRSQTELLQIIAGAYVDPVTFEPLPFPGGGGGTWGAITGTLSNQTDLQAALDLKQPLDGDLTALAAASRVGAIYYRSASSPIPAWDPVKYGAGIQFINGILSTVTNQSQLVPEATKSSSATLNLSGETETNYDITGTANISAITLEEGRTVLLRFTGTGLTLVPSGSLQLPGGLPIITAPNGWGLFLGGPGGTVTCTDYQSADGYSKQTLGNTYMEDNANIGYSEVASGIFSIGGARDPVVDGASPRLLFKHSSSRVAITRSDKSYTQGGAHLDISLLGLGIPTIFRFPFEGGIFVTDITLAALTSDDVTLASDSSVLFPTVHAAKTYADNLKAGLKFKVDCVVASTANVNIASAPASIDAVTLTSGDRVLLKNQTTGSQNGSYVFNGTGNAMTRTTDGDSSAELISATFPIREGTANQDTWWTITNDTITLGTTAIVFSQTGGAGTYVAGSGLLLTGNSFAVVGVTFAMLDAAAWEDDGSNISILDSSTTLPTSHAVNSFVSDNFVANANIGAYLVPYALLAGGTYTGQIITAAGSTASNSAGLKLQSGALQTTAQAGAIEFLTDGLYFTKTTGPTRMAIPLGPAAGPITFTGPTAARSIALPNLNFTVARSDGANTFTGVQTMTSPALTTPAITGLATGSGVASAATASTLVARDASGDITTNRLIAGHVVRKKGYTVAGLPAGTQGDTAFVTDALAPSFLAIIVGGGAVVTPVFYNGTNWVGY